MLPLMALLVATLTLGASADNDALVQPTLPGRAALRVADGLLVTPVPAVEGPS